MLFSKNTVIREAVTIGAFYMAGALLSEIIGLGGTKQSGLGPNKHWPLVCHHMEYKKGEPWSLVALCNSTINLGLEYLEGDPAADP